MEDGERGKRPVDHKGITNPHGPESFGEIECKRLVTLIYFRNHRFDPLFDLIRHCFLRWEGFLEVLFFAHATPIRYPCG